MRKNCLQRSYKRGKTVAESDFNSRGSITTICQGEYIYVYLPIRKLQERTDEREEAVICLPSRIGKKQRKGIEHSVCV